MEPDRKKDGIAEYELLIIGKKTLIKRYHPFIQNSKHR
jgi:hypothetical protein